MEGTDSAFFYAVRAYGLSPTVICLTEQTHLDWRGRMAYLSAKAELRRTELYTMDMVWLLAKKYYEISSPQPSKLETEHKPVDRRNASQIKDDMLKKAQGL